MNIVASIRQHDQVIFEAVFHDYHEKVYLYVLHKTGSAYIAEECTQLTFIKLWKYRLSLSEDYPISVQIFRIARTTMIDLIRKKKRAAFVKPEPASHNEVWNIVREKELNSQLLQALETMPPVRKKVFEMSRLKGMSTHEISSELSISVKAVEYHITQALKYLRNYFTSVNLSLLIIFSCFFPAT